VTSWDRSAARVPLALSEAPVDDPDGVRQEWERSPLRVAVSRLESELRSAAEEGDLAIAVSDPGARILWACQGVVDAPACGRCQLRPRGALGRI